MRSAIKVIYKKDSNKDLQSRTINILGCIIVEEDERKMASCIRKRSDWAMWDWKKMKRLKVDGYNFL